MNGVALNDQILALIQPLTYCKPVPGKSNHFILHFSPINNTGEKHYIIKYNESAYICKVTDLKTFFILNKKALSHKAILADKNILFS